MVQQCYGGREMPTSTSCEVECIGGYTPWNLVGNGGFDDNFDGYSLDFRCDNGALARASLICQHRTCHPLFYPLASWRASRRAGRSDAAAPPQLPGRSHAAMDGVHIVWRRVAHTVVWDRCPFAGLPLLAHPRSATHTHARVHLQTGYLYVMVALCPLLLLSLCVCARIKRMSSMVSFDSPEGLEALETGDIDFCEFVLSQGHGQQRQLLTSLQIQTTRPVLNALSHLASSRRAAALHAGGFASISAGGWMGGPALPSPRPADASCNVAP